MASVYKRKDSPFIYLQDKDPKTGKRRNTNTGLRKDSPADRMNAKRLAKIRTLEEQVLTPVRLGIHQWENWVFRWINTRWRSNGKPNGTLATYTRHYWKLMGHFKKVEVTQPSALKREHVEGYFLWRTGIAVEDLRGDQKIAASPVSKHEGVKVNTALYEINFLAQIMDEAIARGYTLNDKNPARDFGVYKEPRGEKTVWLDSEIDLVRGTLYEREKYGWMYLTFLMGYFQAIRLRQSEVPLTGIDFKNQLINYPLEIVKRGKRRNKGHEQSIDPDFLPILQDWVALQRTLFLHSMLLL